MRLALICILVMTLRAAEEPSVDKLLLRVAEEAEAFGRAATKVIGQEELEVVALAPQPRFIRRAEPPKPQYRTRRVISEYGFALFPEDQNLHEIRQVLTVDGKTVRKPGKLRETLAMGMKGEVDRAKKAMLKDFERYGLKDSASVDFGQAILMFARRQQDNFIFAYLRDEFVGPDQTAVLSYEQKSEGNAAMTVFEGKQVVRHKFQGLLYVRASDGLPLRLTLDASRKGKDVELTHLASIDYQQSPHGFIVPVSLTYTETVNGQMVSESRARYTDFKVFGASSELKFTVQDAPPTPPPTKKK